MNQQQIASDNPFLHLVYEPEVAESLGTDYYDVVAAAEFPAHVLRFRNDDLLPKIGLKPKVVTDEHYIEAFGKFISPRSFLALRYHGYQFGQYNPRLGDGRGFLYGQVRGVDGKLYDLGTKGSGRTPYSRTADGRLTLKGGVREVLAAEALHRLGVNTSRCSSVVETGEALWRGDEPSPTRSCVMVRLSQSHIRFGTFERLHYHKRADLIQKLMDRVIAVYYPEIPDGADKYVLFYQELVERVARLAAQWMSAGFVHGVLNTDNMSISGESFDYGPYAFLETFEPSFTAAYFDSGSRYCYRNQPAICKLNLEMLQQPLAMVMSETDLESGLAQFDHCYVSTYEQLMLQRLGFDGMFEPIAEELLTATIGLLEDSEIFYQDFFIELTRGFNASWRDNAGLILENAPFIAQVTSDWQQLYQACLQKLSEAELELVSDRLKQYNPDFSLIRPVIESVWQPIDRADNWQPFNDLVKQIQTV